MKKVEEIVKKLVRTRTEEHLFNPYNQVDTKCDLNTAPGLRQNNLRIYLSAYENYNVKEIWLTDYLDSTTKLSGVPLIDPSHFYHLKNFLNIRGLFEFPLKKAMGTSETELSSVWNEIKSYNTKPLVWNAIPFYLNVTSNHKLKMDQYEKDLIKYSHFLHFVIEIYRPKAIYTLGKTAQKHLSLLNLTSKNRLISD